MSAAIFTDLITNMSETGLKHDIICKDTCNVPHFFNVIVLSLRGFKCSKGSYPMNEQEYISWTVKKGERLNTKRKI